METLDFIIPRFNSCLFPSGDPCLFNEKQGDYLSVTLEDSNTCLAIPAGTFNKGDKVEMVIRAQKFQLGHRADHVPEQGMNVFFGKIKDRSYMGGEVSYFVELENKLVLHVINFVKRSPYRRGEEVFVRANPDHCRLLKV